METIVYLIRHSKKMEKSLVVHELNNDNYQIKREKIILGVEGERRAEKLSNLPELQDIDIIYSSNYVRAIQTAKYLAEKRNLVINIDSRFGERKLGIHGENDINIDLEQYYDHEIKNYEGESFKEVQDRMYQAFLEAVNNNLGKKVAIYCHGAALTFLLMKWCKLINITEEKKKTLEFKGKIICDKKFKQPEIFKVIIEDGIIKDMINIEIK